MSKSKDDDKTRVDDYSWIEYSADGTAHLPILILIEIISN